MKKAERIAKQPVEIIHNNTSLTMDQVRALPLLGVYKNLWRQRRIELYRLAEGQVISVGTGENPIGTTQVTVAQEADSDHWRALDAFKYGRTYVAE